MALQADERYPVALVLTRTWQQAGQWRYPQWGVSNVLPAAPSDEIPQVCFRKLHSGDNFDHFLWSGFYLEFYRDGLQAYYQNMTGARPSLFILCHEQDEEPGLAPVCICANHGDAEAHMESDGIVLVTPLVSPFSGWLADYVLQHQALFEEQLTQIQQAKKGKHRHV